MNKRYKELEINALNAKSTYERVSEQLEKAIQKKEVSSELNDRIDFLKDNSKRCQKLIDISRELEAKSNTLEIKKDSLSMYINKTNGLKDEVKKKQARLDEILPVVKMKLDMNFIDDESKKLYKESKSLQERINWEIAEMNKAYKKSQRLQREVEALSDSLNKTLTKSNEEMIEIISNLGMDSKILEDADQLFVKNPDRTTKFLNVILEDCKKDIEKLISERNSILDEVEILKERKLIAKDKMEEAEYQFKEYKGMVGVA